MKTFILCFIFLFSTAFGGEIQIKVNGMVCSMCAQGIKKKFFQLNTIEKIQVNLDQKLVSIKTLSGSDISDEKINQLIQEAGYNVVKIERK